MKIALALLLTSYVQVYGACHKPKVDFYFANGMFNSQASARESLKALQKRLGYKYSQDIYSHYEVSYNTDEFVLLQLLQVYRQKMEDGTISFWKWLGDFSNFKDSEIFKDQLQKIFSAQSVEDRDLTKQIARYQKSLNEEYSVVTVAHSQGNFYTNFAFEKLNSEKTKMVSVATPASTVYGDGPYFTFKSDGVIAYIPSALPPNLERNPAGLFDHEFVKHYLDDPSTENEILGSIHNFYENLNEPIEEEFNSDLDNVVAWHEENSKKKRSDKMSDCLLSYALFKLKATSLTCGEKNFSRLLKYLTDCHKDRLDEKKEETSCPFWRGMDIADYFYAQESGFPLKGDSAFLDLHPHCQMDSYKEYMSRIETSDIEEAIQTLEKLRVQTTSH
jgi:hypothetical protein